MGLKWIMAAAMLLVATNFVMAAAVRVAVVGEEETVREIRSRLEAEQDIVLAEWKDAPEVSTLYDPKIAAYPLPEADFLIVAAKERLVAVLNLRHSYLAAEFSPGREPVETAQRVLERIRNAATAEQSGYFWSVVIEEPHRLTSGTGGGNAPVLLSAGLEEHWLKEPSCLVIDRHEPEKSCAEGGFFRYCFPIRLNSWVVRLREGKKNGFYLEAASFFGRRMFVAYTKEVPVTQETAVQLKEFDAGLKLFLKRNGAEKSPERQSYPNTLSGYRDQLGRLHIFSDRWFDLWAAAIKKYPYYSWGGELTQRSGGEQAVANSAYSSDHAFSMARKWLSGMREMRLRHAIPKMDPTGLVALSLQCNTFPRFGKNRKLPDIDWDAIKTLAAEARREYRLWYRARFGLKYDPERGLRTVPELQAYFRELENVGLREHNYYSLQDYYDGLSEVIAEEIRAADAFLTAEDTPERQRGIPPIGQFILSESFSTNTQTAVPERRILYEQIEAAQRSKSKLIRQLGCFWQLHREQDKVEYRPDESLKLFREYCRQVKEIYGREAPYLAVVNNKLEIKGGNFSIVQKKFEAIAAEVFGDDTDFLPSERELYELNGLGRVPPRQVEKFLPVVRERMDFYLTSAAGKELQAIFNNMAWGGDDYFLQHDAKERRELIERFNSKVELSTPVPWGDRGVILNSIMRGGMIYLVGFRERQQLITLYRFNPESRQLDFCASSKVDLERAGRFGRGIVDTCGMFDVEGDYAVWMREKEGDGFRPDGNVFRPGIPKERVHVFDLKGKKAWTLTDFPHNGLRSVALLGGKLYIALNSANNTNSMLVRCDLSGDNREVLFDTGREEEQNSFDARDPFSRFLLRSNPFRGRLLLFGDSVLYEMDPNTMEASEISDETLGGNRTIVGDETLYIPGMDCRYLTYNLKSGKLQRVAVFDCSSTGVKEQDLLPYQWRLKFNYSYAGIPARALAFVLQGNRMLQPREQMVLIDLDHIEQSPPVLVPRQFNASPADAYPAKDGKSFWLVLPEGKIQLLTPR